MIPYKGFEDVWHAACSMTLQYIGPHLGVRACKDVDEVSVMDSLMTH
jgi:hypothetical protein